MTDLATLSLVIDARQLDAARQGLDRFGAEGERTERRTRRASDEITGALTRPKRASDDLTRSMGLVGGEATSMGQTVRRASDLSERSLRGIDDGLPGVTASIRGIGTSATAAAGDVTLASGRIGGAIGRIGRSNAFRNTSLQLNQVVQQGAATGNYLSALAIQLPDLLLGFGTFGIVLGIAAGALAPFVLDLFAGGEGAKTFAESVEDISDSLKSYSGYVSDAVADTDDLVKKFGAAGEEARATIAALAENQRFELASNVTSALRNNSDPFGLSSSLRGLQPGVLADYFELDRSFLAIGENAREARDAIDAMTMPVQRAANAMAAAADLDVASQLSAAERMLGAYTAAADANGERTESERAYISALGETILKIREMQELDRQLAAMRSAQPEPASLAEETVAAAQEQAAAERDTASAITERQVAAADAAARSVEDARLQAAAALGLSETTEVASASAISLNDALRAVAEEGGGAIVAGIPDASSAFANGMAEMTASASAAQSDVTSAISLAMDDAIATVIGAGPRLSAAGATAAAQLIAGLSLGLQRGAESVHAQIDALAGAVESRFRSAMEIQSPSRVMERLGGYVAAGVAVGVERRSGDVYEQVHTLADGMIEEASRAVDAAEGLGRDFVDALISGDFGSWSDGIRDQGTSAFADVVSTGLDQGFSAAMGSIGQSWGQLTSGLGGLFSGGGMASLGQALSGALPFIGMATTALQLLDSFSSTETIGRGLSGTLGGTGGARASDYERTRTTSFWGLSSSTSTDTRLNRELSGVLMGEVRGVQDAIAEMTASVGIAAGNLSDYAYRFKFDTRGLSESEVQERLNRELRAYADAIAAGELATTAYNRAGETHIAALERMSAAIRAVNPTLEQLGHRAFDVSLAGADAASHLAELMGGLDAFASATQTYFKAFYSDAERTAILTRDLGAQMAALNLAMPQTRVQFRAMVEAIDLSTASGREFYAEMIGLAGAFDQVLPSVANLSAAMQGLIGSTSDVIGSLLAGVTEQQRASDRAADLWYRAADSLRGLISEIRGTAGALVSGAEARRYSEARYQMLLASAIGGDNQAASDLPKAAQAMLEATRATASSRAGLARAEARVLSDLQLASGVSDIEGARHQALAGLLGDQVTLLEDLRDYLNAGGVLEANQLAAFEASLASLGSAIEAVKSITYADISARLDVVLTATDDMAPWMRQALGNAASGITVDVDYIVRAEGLTPDLRWLALAGASEHVKTVEFLAANRMGPELTGLALDRAADIARTVSFTIGSRLPADLTRLALAGSSELTRTVNAALASGVDARALRLALGNVGAYEVAVRAALDPGVSGDVRRIVFADAGTYAVTVQAALSASMDPAARRALLEAQGEVAVNIVGTIGPGTTPAEKLLLLNANTAALRGITVAMAFPSSVTAAERALLLESSTSAIRAITALVNPLRVTPDELLFLRELSETGVVQRALEGTVWTRDMGWTDQALLTQLGLGHGVVQRALAARVELHAMGWTDTAILTQLSAGAGAVRRTVDGKMFADAGSWTRHALLTQLVEGDGAVRRSVQGKMFAEAGSWTRNNLLAQLAAGDGSVQRAVQGKMFAEAGSWTRNNLLAQLAAGDGAVRRAVQGQMFATAGTWARNTLLAQLAEGDGGVRRNVDGRMFANTGTWARDAVLSQLAAGEGTIRRILAGQVDVSALSGPQRALLEALASGSAAGTLTLGGTFRFDPSAAFGTALEAGFRAPSEQLRGALDQLRGAILTNAAATTDAAVAARVNSIAGGLLGNDKGQTVLTDTGIADLARRLGVSQEGGVYSTVARIAGLSATDSISSILRDKSGYQTRQALMGYLDTPGLRVKPAGYFAAYDDTAKFKFGAQEHFERHGLKEILSGSRTLDPKAFDWSSIGLNVPGYAAGTRFAPGGMAWVGERGPELMDVPRGARVYSAPESRRMVDNREVVAAIGRLEAQVDHLRDENAAQARVIAYEVKRSADLAQRSEDIGQPAVRTEGA